MAISHKDFPARNSTREKRRGRHNGKTKSKNGWEMSKSIRIIHTNHARLTFCITDYFLKLFLYSATFVLVVFLSNLFDGLVEGRGIWEKVFVLLLIGSQAVFATHPHI